MWTRRKFLQQSVLAGSGFLYASNTAALDWEANETLTILHTNDVHSRLEAFPMDAGKMAGRGGVAARAAIVKKIRTQQQNVLLLDAGDIFQGTPFFNVFNGEPEIKAMSAMQYDAATMGNHDFDAGIETFAKQLQHASFPILLCNYNFTNTVLEQKTLPYKIFKKGKLTIGVTGVGIALKGLVPDNLYGNTQYLDPVEEANKVAGFLKTKKSCDLVICLSHLGYSYKNNKVSDMVLAKESYDIDVIIGGHTHTFLEKPVIIKNKKGGDVFINQVGWGGVILGRLDFTFTKQKNKKLHHAETILLEEKKDE